MVEAGIKKVYGIVGDSANPIVDALRRHEADITFIHVRNEEAGAFAAGADSQISGRPTAVLGSSGPGSVHLLNGLYDCQRNGASVFAIATHIPSAEIGTGYFQETKPAFIFEGACNYVGTIGSASQVPRVSELAIQAAILGRGVGLIILPGDIAAAEVPSELMNHPIITQRPVIRPTDADLDRAAALIAKAEQDRDLRRRGHAPRARRGARAVAQAARPDRLRIPRQGRARSRQPERRRHDRAARLGRRHRGARPCRPRADARHRLLLPRLPAGAPDDHPGRRQRLPPRASGERRSRPHRRRRRDAACAAAPAAAAHRFVVPRSRS